MRKYSLLILSKGIECNTWGFYYYSDLKGVYTGIQNLPQEHSNRPEMTSRINRPLLGEHYTDVYGNIVHDIIA